MDEERDARSGRFTTEYPVSEFIDALEAIGSATTREIAAEVGCSYDLAYRRLKELAEENQVKVDKIGNTFHWHPKRE